MILRCRHAAIATTLRCFRYAFDAAFAFIIALRYYCHEVLPRHYYAAADIFALNKRMAKAATMPMLRCYALFSDDASMSLIIFAMLFRCCRYADADYFTMPLMLIAITPLPLMMMIIFFAAFLLRYAFRCRRRAR